MAARPDYRRVRRFLAHGGHLQRDDGNVTRIAYWRPASRHGPGFAAETCEWLAGLSEFRLDGQRCHLTEPRPGIFHLEVLPPADEGSEPAR
jgi:hypothetical protein